MAKGTAPTQPVAKARYEALKGDREDALRRARENARLTLPWLFPPEGSTGSTRLYRPVQTIGAVGVTRLAGKMTTALFPPNYPFFRHDADEFAASEAEEQEEGSSAEVVKKLAMYDRSLMRQIEALGDRPKIDLAAKQLLVGGNACLDLSGEKGRVIPLANYVCSRDTAGLPVEAIILEKVHPASLEPEVVALLTDDTVKDPQARASSTEEYDLFTYIKLVEGTYQIHQEIEDKVIPDTDYTKKVGELDYLFLRFTIMDGDDYGRAYVDDLYGDLESLEALQVSLNQAADIAAKVVWMVRPGGSTKATTLARAKNGSVITGDANEVTALRLDKNPDMQVTKMVADRIEDRLSDRFLLRSSIQRTGERVTAEEIRTLAEELDAGLSGVYSLLSQDFQMPYLTVRKGSIKTLPKLPEGVISPIITTGLEAMRRSQELEGLSIVVRGVQEAFGPDAAAKTISRSGYTKRLCAAVSVDPTGLILSEEEATNEEVRNGLATAATQAAPAVIQGAMQQ